MFFSKLALLLFASAEVPFALSMAHADKMIDAHDDARLLELVSGTGSCIGEDACNNAGGGGGYAKIGDGSCDGDYSCMNVGDRGGEGTVGTNSCGGFYACDYAGGGGGNANIGDGSCDGDYSCMHVGDGGGEGTVGTNSCGGVYACVYAAGGGGGNANIGDESCNGDMACFSAGGGGGNANIGDESCIGEDACYSAGSTGNGTIGNDSCKGDSACSNLGYSPDDVGIIGTGSCNGYDACKLFQTIQIGSGSCNGDQVCQCLDEGDVVPDNSCNSFGPDECCIDSSTKGSLVTSPTASPTSSPTASPTSSPTASPTSSPTASPTSSPTAPPTSSPTAPPTSSPTASPTSSPTAPPTSSPTAPPTSSPTAPPTSSPTASPTSSPTASPTSSPTVSPFSWKIDPSGNWTATFDDQSAGNELEGQYEMTVGRHYKFEVLKPDCISAIANNNAIKYLEPESKTVPESGVVDAKIDIDMDELSTITDTEVFSEDADANTDKIEICIKGSLQVSDTDTTVVNYHETKLTIFIDKTRTFVVDVDTERTAATDKSQNVTLDYNVTTFICADGELNNSSTWLEANSSYSQGEPLKVCLRAPSTDGVNLDKVTKFELEQVTGGSAGKSVMIGDNNDVMAGGILANSQCTKNACMIQSMIPAKYFDDIDDGTPYNLKAGGDIVLKFGERRLKGVLVDSSSIGRSGAISRGLQSEESAVSSSFEVSVGLKGENMVEDDGREVSAANPIFAGRLPVLLSFVGAVLFTGVALVN